MALISKDDKPGIEVLMENYRQKFQEMVRLASFGEILGGVAHEINNPLQIILGKAQILLMRMTGDKNSLKSIDDLKAIERAAQRIAELINSLNELAQKRSEERDLKIDIDLNYLIGSILALIRASLKDKKIELSLDLPGNLPKVKGNPLQLKELFLYLTLNAKQRINRGGELKVSFKEEEEYLDVKFSDQGEKLSLEISRYIEDPLSLQKENKSGFGILNSYKILKGHKGELNLKSSPGRGNSITVRLPLV